LLRIVGWGSLPGRQIIRRREERIVGATAAQQRAGKNERDHWHLPKARLSPFFADWRIR
jgi:hypothetical protein